MGIERKELIYTWQQFWDRKRIDRPLVGYLYDRRTPLSQITGSGMERLLKPQDLTIDVFKSECERRYSASLQIGGDAIFVASPLIGLPWLEAIMGCSIRAASGVGWAEPLGNDWREYSLSSVSWDNGWYDSIKRQISAAIKASQGRYPIGPSHIRGPGDIAFALLGPAEFCYALYDYPQKLQSLIQICGLVWEKLVDTQYKLLLPESGGYWNANQPLWTPGKNMVITADVASIISPEMFGSFLLKTTKGILRNIDYGIMHMHSSYLHPVEMLLPIKKIKAIQISLDPNGPELSMLLPVFRKIQQSKALIVGGQTRSEDIDTLISELSPEGFCILSTNPELYTHRLSC